MQTMQDKLTEEFRRLAEGEAGLEFVTDPRGTSGSWYIMDGLDTRMVISYKFEQDCIDMSLIGQAVEEPDSDFFKARQLRSRFGGSPFQGVQMRGPRRHPHPRLYRGVPRRQRTAPDARRGAGSAGPVREELGRSGTPEPVKTVYGCPGQAGRQPRPARWP